MNMIKNLIPNFFFLLGYLVALLVYVLSKISVGLYYIGTILHIKFGTVIGKSIQNYKTSLDTLTDSKTSLKNKIVTKEIKTQTTNSRLFKIINGDNNAPSSKL